MIPEMGGRSDAPESLHRTGYSSTGFGRKVDERRQKRGRKDRGIESKRSLVGEAQEIR